MSRKQVRIYKTMNAELTMAKYAEMKKNENEAMGLLYTVVIAICAWLLGA